MNACSVSSLIRTSRGKEDWDGFSLVADYIGECKQRNTPNRCVSVLAVSLAREDEPRCCTSRSTQ